MLFIGGQRVGGGLRLTADGDGCDVHQRLGEILKRVQDLVCLLQSEQWLPPKKYVFPKMKPLPQPKTLTFTSMNIKRHIPNFLTCCNLACGVIGIVILFTPGIEFVGESRLEFVVLLVVAAAIFDFFDGFAARLLKVSSPIGKDLDSLADLVTFGVLPGMILFTQIWILESVPLSYLAFTALLIPVFSALRLAKFNNDERQSDAFIGLPTPANALFISFLIYGINSDPRFVSSILSDFWLFQQIGNPWAWSILAIFSCYLLVAEIPMFALKFKNFSWADNKIRFVFIGMAVLCLIGGLLIKNVFISIPIIILLYLLISIGNNLFAKNAVQS